RSASSGDRRSLQAPLDDRTVLPLDQTAPEDQEVHGAVGESDPHPGVQRVDRLSAVAPGPCGTNRPRQHGPVRPRGARQSPRTALACRYRLRPHRAATPTAKAGETADRLSSKAAGAAALWEYLRGRGMPEILTGQPWVEPGHDVPGVAFSRNKN